MQKHLTGLIAATHTPMNNDGSINYNMIDKQADSLMANGVNGAFICGTNGEGLLLTIEERMKIAERWMGVAGDDLNIIVHVGHNCLSDCQTLASHAQKIGAKAIAAVGPSYFKPSNADNLVNFCAMIAVSAPLLPFYYYHIPFMSGINIPAIEFLRKGKERIPTLTGIKFTHDNLMDLSLCLAFDNSRYDILFGKDEILLSAMVLGSKGAVGSTYNFAAPLYHIIMTAYQAGELETACAEQYRAVEMISILLKFGGIVAGKAIMKMIGIDCGPVRPPLCNISKEQYDQLYAELSEAGFFTYCSLQSKGDMLI
jgi:N-acetylneuraminate lyase